MLMNLLPVSIWLCLRIGGKLRTFSDPSVHSCSVLLLTEISGVRRAAEMYLRQCIGEEIVFPAGKSANSSK